MKVAQSCQSLCNPMPGSSVHEISQGGSQEWIATPSSRGSFQPRNPTCISYISPGLAGGFFTTGTTWEALQRWWRLEIAVSQTEPEAKQIGELKTLLPPTGKQRKGLSQNLSFNFTGTENNSSNSVKKHSKPFNNEKMTVLQRLNKVTEHFDLTDREFKTGLRKLRDKKTKKSS